MVLLCLLLKCLSASLGRLLLCKLVYKYFQATKITTQESILLKCLCQYTAPVQIFFKKSIPSFVPADKN